MWDWSIAFVLFLCVALHWVSVVQAVASRRALRTCFIYTFGLVCYKRLAFDGLCLYPACIFTIESLVASLSFWFCLSVSFCSGMSLLPPLMLDWSVGSFGLIMFRYFFLSWLLLICWLLACLFFFLSDACSKPAIPKVHRMSQHTWAQSTLQLITLLRAGHGKVLATECVRRW